MEQTIYFYQWSNITYSNRLTFKSFEDFAKFCEDCGITFTVTQRLGLLTRHCSHAVCKPGKAELLTGKTLYILKDGMRAYKKRNSVKNG